MNTTRQPWLAPVFALTIFLSAFLLFQVQPLISKFILPWFGGTPSVWTTCMLFFQLALFTGYAYAHLTTVRLAPKTQAGLHIILLIIALAFLPIIPSAGWKPSGSEQPTVRIVLLLSAAVGVPFFVLSATGPLLQAWFSRAFPNRNPYWLYALSNVGSLVALVTYPFVFEPLFSTSRQAYGWSWGFAVFVVGCGACGFAMRFLSTPSPQGEWTTTSAGALALDPHVAGTMPAVASTATELAPAVAGDCEPDVPPAIGTRMLWFVLPMVASVMLLATTNQVCIDVASVPFLWILPLTLYLLSFILCFAGNSWYSRWPFAVAMMGMIAAAAYQLKAGAAAELSMQVLVYFSLLFFSAMFCHGELVAIKPHPRYLTSFYLLISAGGAAGGVLVGAIAPYVFPEFVELQLGMVLCAALLVAVLWRDPRFFLYRGQHLEVWVVLLAIVGTLAGALAWQATKTQEGLISVSRNFYGVLRVKKIGGANGWLTLTHGRILHGLQFLPTDENDMSQLPTTYYGEKSGVGRVLLDRKPGTPKRVGAVGLGTGTVACYARDHSPLPKDVFRFYDINADVVRVNKKFFTYLTECKGEPPEVVLGDARLKMEEELKNGNPQNYDVIVLDAFSSDAIPIHLLTVEAFEIYLKHLVPDGILAVHISNRHFDLRPVVDALADHYGMTAYDINDDVPDDDAQQRSSSEWVLVSRDPDALDIGQIPEDAQRPQLQRVLWTDDNSSLLEIMRDKYVDRAKRYLGRVKKYLHGSRGASSQAAAAETKSEQTEAEP